MNAQTALTVVIALGGFAGTILLLILNLKVQAAMGEMRSEVAVDMSKIQVEMATLRADTANDRANTYEKIMENIARLYIPREVQETMHRVNVGRLDDLKTEIQHLGQRVSDIG